MIQYQKFYNDERYLLEEVGPQFRKTGVIDPPDFYMILIWKAERAKTNHLKRLKNKAGTFRGAVSEIASALFNAHGQKERLRTLMDNWGFYIPTATAILTILYPEEFTVYDTVACSQVGCAYKPWREFSDRLWADYEEFRAAVIRETPAELSLRDKDRFLMGKAFRESVERDCAC